MRVAARWTGWTGALCLFVLYYVTGRIGLSFDAVDGLATTIWPPTGIALVGLFTLGLRAWPAVAAAAFLVNIHAGAPLVSGAGIAAGNTLEALVGAQLLLRLGFSPHLSRLRDVLVLLVPVGLGSTLLSATAGTAVTWATTGVSSGHGFFWLSWWLGDVMGNWVVAPLGFLLVNRRPAATPGGWRPVLLAFAVLVAASVVVMSGTWSGGLHHTYFLFPPLIVVVLVAGQRGAVAATLVVSSILLGCTLAGSGPFVRASLEESLVYAQSFLGVMSVTMLILGAAIEERRRAVQLREDFVAMASHELRAPIQAARLRLEAAVRNLPQPTPARQHVVRSMDAVDRLSRIVNELLDVSRISAGKLTLRKVPVRVDELAARSLEPLQEALGMAECSLSIEAEPVTAQVDPLLVGQALMNLVTNGIKYAAGSRITVMVTARDGDLVLTVRDGGPGIPPSEQAKIFDRFERGQARGGDGLGLGLFLVREIMTAHGGRATLDSRVDEGARFHLTFPGAVSSAN